MGAKVALVAGGGPPALREELAAISERAFCLPPWKMTGSHQPLVERLMAFPHMAVFVATGETDSRVAGFSLGAPLSEELLAHVALPPNAGAAKGDYHLTWRAVDPECQRKGLGLVLTQVRLEHAGRLGCPRIFGETIHKNLGTLQMYARLGFEVYAERQLVGNVGLFTKLYFRKALATSGIPQ